MHVLEDNIITIKKSLIWCLFLEGCIFFTESVPNDHHGACLSNKSLSFKLAVSILRHLAHNNYIYEGHSKCDSLTSEIKTQNRLRCRLNLSVVNNGSIDSYFLIRSNGKSIYGLYLQFFRNLRKITYILLLPGPLCLEW